MIVGGIIPLFIARIVIIAWMLPEVPRECPSIDLLAVIGICLALSPKTFLIAVVSVLSLSTVAVPCAPIKSISSGLRLALFKAVLMALVAPSAVGEGWTRW